MRVFLLLLIAGCGGSSGGANASGTTAGTTNAGTTTSSGGSVPGTQPAICASYVACALAATPMAGAQTLAAYGPMGTCWEQTDALRGQCVTACQNGLAALHNIDAKDCPLCAADTDCTSGVCDSARGECVECVTNAQCTGGAPVCRNDKCVAGCVDSSQCPHGVCDTSSNQCVECLGSGDCPAGDYCSPFTSQCTPLVNSCTPYCPNRVCGPSLSADCGFDDPTACGVCPNNGKCYSGACQDLGNPCTKSSDCYAGEDCIFDRDSKGYMCMTGGVPGQSCNNEYSCYVAAHAGSGFLCPSGKCQNYCLSASDCASGNCQPWGSATISAATPGLCAL